MKTSRDHIDSFNISQLENAILESGIVVPSSPSVNVMNKEESTDSCQSETDDTIEEMNNYFTKQYYIYKDILAPQLIKNEELKRRHKSRLMNNIFTLLKCQFIVTYIFIVIFILMIAFNVYLQITTQVIIEIFSFLKFYITSIVVELISILFFIVKNVFDKSIVDLFKNFDKQKDDLDLLNLDDNE